MQNCQSYMEKLLFRGEKNVIKKVAQRKWAKAV